MLQTFLPLFLMTFFICLFIFMMQFLYLWFSIVVNLLNVIPTWSFRYLTELKNTLEISLEVVVFASTLCLKVF